MDLIKEAFIKRQKVKKRFLINGRNPTELIRQRILADDATSCPYCGETKFLDKGEIMAENLDVDELTGVMILSDMRIKWYGYRNKFRNEKYYPKEKRRYWYQDTICCTTCGCIWRSRQYPALITGWKDYRRIVDVTFKEEDKEKEDKKDDV